MVQKFESGGKFIGKFVLPVSDTPPDNPEVGQVWVDKSKLDKVTGVPALLMFYDGIKWAEL